MTGNIKRAFHDAPLGQIHYRYIFTSATEKKAPVVFLHQSASCGWCYQSMMKDFGASYDPVEDSTSTRYYVDIFMGLFRHLRLPKMHLVGHHSGAALAMEMSAVYPSEVFTCALSGPALAIPEEQAKMFKNLARELSKPKEDGSHLMKVWNLMNGELYTDLDIKNHEVIDTLRAWKGRDQAYAVTFKQNKLAYYEKITVLILAMCSEEDVLWPCFHYCQKLVSLKLCKGIKALTGNVQQPNARCEITTSNFIDDSKDIKGSIAYYHVDFLEKLGA
ncbi:alpha/beta-hydrolase [Mollisia scopiformis]|uniref:Alpha/beta-hydrolase n=1 Tax=Mollisia scopiformis TaxID=149040 RepID=A0A194XP89_MOLSC|nr:alpha/beta-hydrolase [Mollisia scopiformis]KUJ21552.1 alpha/beta-hydrolase [Mollisia scopiformis]